MNTNGTLLKATTFLFLITIGSKVTGFLKEIFIARTFGATFKTDAFIVAFTVPNSIFYIISGGLTTVIIPTYAKYMKERTLTDFNNVYSNLVSQLMIFSLLASVFGIFFSSQIVNLIASGLPEDAIVLSSNMLKIMFPTLIFTILISINTGLLNTQNVFGVGEMSPLILNLFIILFCVFLSGPFDILALPYAVLLGTFASLIYILYRMRGKAFKYQFTLKFNNEIGYIYKLMLPIILSSGIIELYMIINKYLASNMDEGSISSLNYAQKVLGLPEGLLVAFSSVLFPTLSKLAFEKDRTEFSKTIFSGLKVIFLLAVPISIVFLLLSNNIISFLFQGGKFDSSATEITSEVLFYFSFAIIGLGANPLLYRSFFAMHETKKPLVITILSVIINVLLSLSLSSVMGLKGLALANSIAVLINIVLQIALLKNNFRNEDIKDFYKFNVKLVLIGSVTYLLVYFINKFVVFDLDFLEILIKGLIILLLFYTGATILKIKELLDLKEKLINKFGMKKGKSTL